GSADDRAASLRSPLWRRCHGGRRGRRGARLRGLARDAGARRRRRDPYGERRAAGSARGAPPSIRTLAAAHRSTDAAQSHAARWASVSVLRETSASARTQYRSYFAALSRRRGYLGKSRDGVPNLQLAEGMAYAR